MKETFKIATLIVVIVGAVAYMVTAADQRPSPPPAFAQAPGGPGARGPGMHPGGPGPMLPLDALDLTSDQRQAVRDILDKNRDAAQAAAKAAGEATRALHEAIASDANETTIRIAATTMADAAASEGILQVKTSKAIKALLTSDQIARLDRIRAEMKNLPFVPQGGPAGFMDRPEPMPQIEPLD
jgi:Spy/CpxP family protein refolding chaperone